MVVVFLMEESDKTHGVRDDQVGMLVIGSVVNITCVAVVQTFDQRK